MKRLFLLILFISFAVISCSRRETGHQLDKIESCLQDFPDSALTLLQSMDKASIRGPRNQARFALLYSLALDKNYVDITDDSLAHVAVDYYAGTQDRRRSMLAWYSLGRVQVNAGNAAGAIVSYMKAKRDADQLEDYHYLGLINREIGYLYSGQQDAESAISYFEESASCFSRLKEERYEAFSLYALALEYNLSMQTNRSDSLLNQLSSFADRTGDTYLLSQILVSKGSIELLKDNGDVNLALEEIKTGKALSGESYTSQDAQYVMMIYSALHQSDSAAFYRAIAQQEMLTPRDSSSYYAALNWIQEREGDYRGANQTLRKSIAIQNRLMNQRESMEIANRLSDFHRQEAAYYADLSARRKQILILAVSLFAAIMLALLARLKVRVFQNREKEKLLQEKDARIQEDLARTEEIMNEIRLLDSEKSKVLEGLASSILGQMKMVKKWSEAYYSIKKPFKDPNRLLDSDANQKKEDIIRNFCESLEIIRNDEHWFDQLEDQVNRWKNDIMARARRVCYQPDRKKQTMSESDFRTLLLMFAGLPDKAIAYFLDLTYGAVRMRRLRYKEFFEMLPDNAGTEFKEEL